MTHPSSTSLELAASVEDRLPEARRLEVRRHLESCEECRGWVEAYRLLADYLALPAAPLSTGHLESDILCRFALAERTLDEMTRQRCLRHLESCAECTEEAALVRAGATEARDTGRWTPVRATPWRARLAWAAGLVLAAAVLLITQGTDRIPERGLTSDPQPVAQAAVRTSETILVEAMQVESGSDLTLVGKTVAFGNDFLVSSGGTLSVVLEKGHDS